MLEILQGDQASAAFIGGVIGVLGVLIGGAMSLLGALVNRRAELNHKRREVAANAIFLSHTIETALKQLHVPGEAYMPKEVMQANLAVLNNSYPEAYRTCILLSSTGGPILEQASTRLANSLTIAANYLHPVTGSGMKEDFVGLEDQLQSLEDDRTRLVKIAQRGWFRQWWFVLFNKQGKVLREKD